MIDRIRAFKQVPRIIFGKGAFEEIEKFIKDYREKAYIVVLFDNVHETTGLKGKFQFQEDDYLFAVDTTEEPKTSQIDEIRDQILKDNHNTMPSLVIGIGGGSTLDIAKAVSVMLTNEGSSTLYQGWDLVKKDAIPKLAIPTLSGTGAEASRTAVLTAKDKKFGINSDQSMFDVVMMDPDLIKTVPNDQRFYTGMDCYIHCVESIEGLFINSFGKVYAQSALESCRKVFLNQGGTDEDLMVASYMGGASVANSEVGVVHAMSYGLSLILGYKHGIANCIAFDQLEEFYPEYVPEFRKMMELNNIILPKNITKNITDDQMDKMLQMTLKMERPLASALGNNWKKILTEDKITSIYKRM